MIVLRLVYLFMPVSIVLAFLWAPEASLLEGTGRIIYFHVPVAWVSVLAFLVAGIASIVFLVDREKRFAGLEEKAHASASLGMVFCLLSVVSGSLWARISWGSYWNWDPRELSIVILLSVYIAYFSLRAGLAGNENRGRISAAYLIFAMAMVPLFIFIIPRLSETLHPATIINAERKIHLEEPMRVTLLFCVISFTLLYFYILHLMNRMNRIEKVIQEKELS